MSYASVVKKNKHLGTPTHTHPNIEQNCGESYRNLSERRTSSDINYKLEKIKEELLPIEISISAKLAECESYINMLKNKNSTPPREKLDEINETIDRKLLEMDEIQQSVSDFKSSFHTFDIFNIQIKDNLKSLQDVKKGIKTEIYKCDLKDVHSYCKEVGNISKEFYNFQGNLTELRKIKLKAAQLKFEKNVNDVKIHHIVKGYRNKLKTVLSELENKEKELLMIEEKSQELEKKLENITKEIENNREKALKAETTEELNKIQEDEKLLLFKIDAEVSNRHCSKEYRNYAFSILKKIHYLALGVEKIISEKQKFLKDPKNLQQIIHRDEDLIKSCLDAIKKGDNTQLNTLKNKIVERIKFYQNYDLKEYKDNLMHVKSEQINKLEQIIVALSQIIFNIEKQTLDKKREKQEELCKYANTFWGNLSGLDNLLKEIKNFENEIKNVNVSSDNLKNEKEYLLSELNITHNFLSKNRAVFQAKEEFMAISKKITYVKRAVSSIMDQNCNPLEDFKNTMIKVTNLQNIVNELLKSVQEINTYNHERFNADVNLSKETLQIIRVNLEAIQLRYESPEISDEFENVANLKAKCFESINTKSLSAMQSCKQEVEEKLLQFYKNYNFQHSLPEELSKSLREQIDGLETVVNCVTNAINFEVEIQKVDAITIEISALKTEFNDLGRDISEENVNVLLKKASLIEEQVERINFNNNESLRRTCSKWKWNVLKDLQKITIDIGLRRIERLYWSS